ncbi:RNA-binding S4 domain-containing protein [Sphingomonas antarctica]|uniref:S4 domain-containing protein n=1 Tax=Sphingomonas antarctica TaxID=2040274 RepID=UPI0039EAB49C
MRIDKFLYFARLTKTRASAQALVAAGHLRLDGKRIERDAHPVVPGQVLTMPHSVGVKALRILTLPVRRGPPEEAQLLCEDLNKPVAE